MLGVGMGQGGGMGVVGVLIVVKVVVGRVGRGEGVGVGQGHGMVGVEMVVRKRGLLRHQDGGSVERLSIQVTVHDDGFRKSFVRRTATMLWAVTRLNELRKKVRSAQRHLNIAMRWSTLKTVAASMSAQYTDGFFGVFFCLF